MICSNRNHAYVIDLGWLEMCIWKRSFSYVWSLCNQLPANMMLLTTSHTTVRSNVEVEGLLQLNFSTHDTTPHQYSRSINSLCTYANFRCNKLSMCSIDQEDYGCRFMYEYSLRESGDACQSASGWSHVDWPASTHMESRKSRQQPQQFVAEKSFLELEHALPPTFVRNLWAL